MQQEQDIFPSPDGLLRPLLKSPILLYRTGLGGVLSLLSIMVLTTRGRKSGLPRFTALEFRQHGNKVYVISGWGKQPQWYRNLLVDSQATIRIGRRAIRAHAHTVDDPAEAVRVLYMFRRTAPVLWDTALARMSVTDTVDWKTLTESLDQFTIVRFDLMPEPPVLPVIATDRAWVWPLVLFTLALVIRLLRSRR